MTDAELDRLEALFRNPPSASGLAEHGLVLVAELRKARHQVGVAHAVAPKLDYKTALETMVVPAPMPEFLPERERPTPPIRPHKKGK